MPRWPGDQEEPEYYILNQKVIGFSSGRGIKKAILADHDRYGLENCNIESFNSQDIAAWAQESKIPVETIHATSTAQVPAFTELHRIVNEGRLHFPKELERLAAEMRTFTYDNSGKSPRFGHAQGFHDDTVYSLTWGVWSLREQELAVYELARIVCQSRSKHAPPLCYLRTGGLILPCSEACEAHKRVEAMHLQYRRRKVDSELTLPEFFKAKVKRAGRESLQGRVRETMLFRNFLVSDLFKELHIRANEQRKADAPQASGLLPRFPGSLSA